MERKIPNKKIIINTLKSFKYNSIFIKMLVATFCTFFILCIINFVGIKLQVQKALYNETQNSEFYLDYSYSYIQKLIQKLDEYMYSIEYDNNVVFMRSLPKDSNYAENHTETSNIINRLSIFRSLVEEIADIYIYFPNIDRIFTSQGEYEPYTFFSVNYKGDYDEWKGLFADKYLYTLNIWDFETSKDSFSKLNLVKSFYEGRGAKSVIVANLKSDLVKQLFLENDYAQDRKIYIANKDFLILSSNIADETGKHLDIEKSLFSSSEKGSFYNQDFLISYRYIPDNEIYFVIKTQKETIFENVDNITYIAYFVLVLMLITGVILSVFISRQFYLPIGQMLKDMERFATVSRGLLPRQQNEYDYIKSNINNIYMNNKKLETVIQDSMPFIIDIILLKLIQGGEEIENASLLASQYNIEFKDGYYAAVVMKSVRSYTNTPQKYMADLTAFIRKCIPCDVVSLLKIKEDEIVIVAYFENSGHISGIADQITQLSVQLEEAYEDEVFHFGLGDGAESIYHLHGAYCNACSALNARNVQDNSKVFVYNKAEVDGKENKINIPADFEERYKNAILAGNMDMSEDLIYEILDANYSRNVSFLSYNKMCLWLNSIMERITENMEPDIAKSISRELLEDIGTAGDIIGLNERILKNNRLLCMAYINDKKRDTNFSRILKFIDENFNNNMNLNSVADNFGYNANYLSRLFKQLKGISFTDYLGRKRIEYAKKLLADRRKTIKEIAEESGYNSTGMFIKAFERMEGYTPGEYRKRQ